MLKTLGHDTEAFGKKGKKIIPLSPDILHGTKEEPEKIGSFASLQLDNVLAEITQPPSNHIHHWCDTCAQSKLEAEKWLKDNHEISLVYKSHHKFDLNDVMTPWALQNGCAPDFTADTDDPVDKINMGLFTTLKTASGHIHVGVHKPEELTMSHKIQYVRALDFALGAPLVLLHNDPQRRKLYGRAARFRSKPYGFEYRTPDNWWFGQGDTNLYFAIYEVIQNTMNIGPNSSGWDAINKHHSGMCKAINDGSVDDIKKFMSQNPFYQLNYGKGQDKKAKRRPYGHFDLGLSQQSPDWMVNHTISTETEMPDDLEVEDYDEN